MQENRESQCHDEYYGSRGCLEALCREPWRSKVKCILALAFTKKKRAAAIYQHSFFMMFTFRLCPPKTQNIFPGGPLVVKVSKRSLAKMRPHPAHQHQAGWLRTKLQMKQ